MATDKQIAEFIQLYTSHEVRLRTFALSLIPNWADAEEIVQQASLVMWQKFDQFQPGTNFFAWGGKIVHLTAKDFRKRLRRDVIHFGDRFFDVVSAEAPEIAEELAARERILGECIEKLTPRQKELLRLKYEDGCRGEQMAKILKSSVDAAYEALARIRRALYDCVNRGMHRAGFQ
jgi:RNA polymerase sigma-70 factor (ECF subfamily)